MGRPDYIFGQFRETVRCRDAQHGDRVRVGLVIERLRVRLPLLHCWVA